MDDECQPLYPPGVTGGEVAVVIGEEVYSLPELSDGVYYAYDVLDDLFAANATVTASVAGDVFPAVESLSVRGVATLESDLDQAVLTLTDGTAVEISWVPDSHPEACVRLVLNSQTTAHGLPPTDVIECATTDTGNVTVAAELLEGMHSFTWLSDCSGFDCPRSELSRYVYDRVQLPSGSHDLEVRSTVFLYIEHP